MPNYDISTISLPDGYLVHVRWWRPQNPRGAVLYFHGIQSHGGWYEESGIQLARAGFTVLMPDRRGSGLNAPPRGHFDSIQQCLSDSRFLLDSLLDETGQKNAHVVGVSWGGRPAMLLANEVPNAVKSLTLVGPGMFPMIDLTAIGKLLGGLVTADDSEKLLDIPHSDVHLFTANPARIQFVERDPFRLLQVSVGFLLTSRQMDRRLRRLGDSDYRGPLHLFLVKHDRIIDNERTRNWYDALPSTDRRITEYQDAFHAIEFEEDPSIFFHDLVSWIDQQA